MKKILTLIGCLFCGGCAVYSDPSYVVSRPYNTPIYRTQIGVWEPQRYYGRFHRDEIQIAMADEFIKNAQANEIACSMYGPGNPYSESLWRRQNQLREAGARIQNPWNGYFQNRH